MDLFLIRHAIAEERRAGLPDADRALTNKGRARFEAMVESLDRAGVRFDRVYHSPWLHFKKGGIAWLRAVQTAELLEPITAGPLMVAEGLAQPPEPDFFACLEGKRVACVGHEPWLSDALSLLTTGTPHPASMQLRALWGHSPPS